MQPQIVSFKVAQTKPSLTPCIETKDVPTDLQLDMCQKCGKFQRLKRDPTSASNKFFRISEHTDKLERNERTMFRIPLYPWGSVQYFCAITIEQTVLHSLLDTGSPSIWIPSDRVDRSLWVDKGLLNVTQASSLLVGRDIFCQLYGVAIGSVTFVMGDNLEQLITAPGTPYDDFFATGTNTVSLPEDIHMTTIDGITMCCTRFQNNTPNCPVDIVLGMAFLHPFQLIFDNHVGRVGFSARPEKSFIS
ncbi:hypothetical protein X801_01985 [Opisthorchis viverrini]|uniref:Peptidase A1 domain-containing protein n=1 Tax=Opisthorchis viverrini TaxID=6198 RepID=A0A1S8X5U6_OPIVI|nr:hypothetical protein X801_01985 [Opisthorchis viverrini]